jgi:hypothetical protein
VSGPRRPFSAGNLQINLTLQIVDIMNFVG